jgi:hypothetical protein
VEKALESNKLKLGKEVQVLKGDERLRNYPQRVKARSEFRETGLTFYPTRKIFQPNNWPGWDSKKVSGFL